MKLGQRLLFRVLSVTFPPGRNMPGLDRNHTYALLRIMRKEAPWKLRLAFYGSVFLFLVTPILTVHRPVPALWLSSHTLDRHACKLAGHSNYWIRQSMVMLKVVGGMMWGGDPEIRRSLGWEPYTPDVETRRRIAC